MTKAGERLLAAGYKAVAVARGEAPAARIYVNGHTYVPEAEVEMLTKGCIIEVAVRNPNVAEYMKHWEGRAEAAEQITALVLEWRQARSVVTSMANADPGFKAAFNRLAEAEDALARS